VDGFVKSRTFQSRLPFSRLFENHFDDFDFVIGEQGSAPSDLLRERMRQVQQEDVRKDKQIAKNWKTGNWKVRGFSLDKHDPTASTKLEARDDDTFGEEPKTVHVSKVHESLTPNQVVVGRTDGSVCFVTLGSSYLSHFVNKLSARETGNATIAIESELVPSDIMMGSPVPDREKPPDTPFQVERQFVAHDSAIVALATAETTNHEQLLFSAGKTSGDVHVWALPEEPENKEIPLRTLSNVHSDTVVALTTLSLSSGGEENLLFSASVDGSLALWDVQTGDLVYKCQMVQDEEPCSISCADVDSSKSIIYLGLTSGHVVGYNIKDMIECAGEGETCPVPSGRFLAHEGGITAIKFAGKGILGRPRPGASTSTLLTGGPDGVVKQWEIMSRKLESASADAPSLKLEHWPRITNQRMQKRAHLFKGHAEDEPITALASVDGSKFLSAASDGTIRAWSPSSGEELFRMDGFTDELSSLCLLEGMYLITDGMENLVCVHDFDVDETEYQDGYELEW
jgi:WD40 repeat protein